MNKRVTFPRPVLERNQHNCVKMDVSVENLERAIELFFNNRDNQVLNNDVHNEVHQWLLNVQQSSDAWNLVWQLIMPMKSVNIQFYAATTLHTKILRNWPQIADNYEELKAKILQTIFEYIQIKGPTLILNKLCSSFAALVLQTITVQWPTAIEDIIASFRNANFQNIPPEAIYTVLFEILSLIPNEVSDTPLARTFKNRIKSELTIKCYQVLDTAYEYLSMISNCKILTESQLSVSTVAVNCTSSWIHYGFENATQKFLNLLFSMVHQMYCNLPDFEDLTSTEEDYIDIIFETLNTIAGYEEIYKYPKIVKQFYFLISTCFLPIIETENKKDDPNIDLIVMIYDVPLKLCEADVSALLKPLYIQHDLNPDSYQLTEQMVFNLISSLLDCLNAPGCFPIEETRSNLTFPFWRHLTECLFNLPEKNQQICTGKLRPFFQKMMPILLEKCSIHYFDDVFSEDDRNSFMMYKQDISDIMVLTYKILDDQVLTFLEQNLYNTLSENPIEWRSIQAIFYYFCSLASYVSMEDKGSIHVLKFLQVASNGINYSNFHHKLHMSALDLIKSYAEWFTKYPDLFEDAIKFVVMSLRKPNIGLNSTMALKDLTIHCSQLTAKYSVNIFEEILKTLNEQHDDLSSSERLRLMYSLGRILNVMNAEYYYTSLESILKPLFAEIHKRIMSNDNMNPSALNERLEMLSALYWSLKLKSNNNQGTVLINCDYLQLLIKNTLDIFKDFTLSPYFINNDIMASVCTIFKHMLTNLTCESIQLTFEIVNLVIQMLRNHTNPLIIDVIKRAIEQNERKTNFLPLMQNLLTETVAVVLNVVNKSTQQTSEEFYKNSDFFQEFYNLLSHVCRRNCGLIFDNERLNTDDIVGCATLCLNVSDMDLLGTSCNFLATFIERSRENTTCCNTVQKFAEEIVFKIFLHFGGDSSRTAINYLCHILYALCNKYTSYVHHWFRSTLINNNNFPTSRVTKEQKELFVNKLTHSDRNKKRLGDAVHEFVSACRGIICGKSVM